MFDMRVVFIMFMSERLKGDVPVSADTKGKFPGCVAGYKYVNEQNNNN
jgi:hypothetical protein